MNSLFLFLLMVFPLMMMLNVFTHNKSMLLTLLCLEMLSLSVLLVFTLSNFMLENYNMMCLIILLSIGACEASMGLCILVSMVRSTGSDHTMNLSMSKC
uniref:NADH dehydrogenase subunit 4L n=1 Tax=Haemadipsa yanyuanensis TaxID=2870508 RepID=UPI0023D80B76|nr:NADH dehydrogenase subunit 4L [Haemadipsa yanyuanensis]WDA96165.1 NADH dehydrogenase subunit 4L [Haemadipsa yanyuanensis]